MGDAVFTIRDGGWHLCGYIMYHGTRSENVDSILSNGFRRSRIGMLGRGVYVSKDHQKTETVYGDVTLKLIVYTGKREY